VSRSVSACRFPVNQHTYFPELIYFPAPEKCSARKFDLGIFLEYYFSGDRKSR